MRRAVVAWAVSAVLPLTAQQPSAVQARLLQSIQDLGDQDRAAAAALALHNLGPATVPGLRRLLHWSHRNGEPDARLVNALFVLGDLGRPALAAMPELIDLLDATDGTLLAQVVWVVQRLAPWADARERERLLEVLRRRKHYVGDGFTVGLLRTQLLFPAAPTTDELLAPLTAARCADTDRLAASEWLRTHADEPLPDRAELAQALKARLHAANERHELPWYDSSTAAVDGHLAEAWLQFARADLDADAARGLLSHWQADQRWRGMAWLEDHGASLPLRERLDAIGRLWDADDRVVRAACSAFAKWEVAGLVALAPLRARQRACSGASPPFAATAEHVSAAVQAALPDAGALLAAIDGVLQGGACDVTPAIGANAALVWAEVLPGAQWCGAEVAANLLALAERTGGADRDAIRTVLGWTANPDPMVAAHAFAWLARRGRAVPAALDAGEEEIRRCVRFFANAQAAPAGCEALAWVAAGPDAELEALESQLQSAELRLTSRTLAELLRRGWRPPPSAAVWLRGLVALPDGQTLDVVTGGNTCDLELPIDLAADLRLLAAIALVCGGVTDFAAESVAPDVQRVCGVDVVGLPAWLQQQRATKHFDTFLDEREAVVHARMALPGGLRWPAH